MSDTNKRETLAENFPSNSKTQRVKTMEVESQEIPERKKLEKIATGKVMKQKRGFGKKIAETFLEDATQNVKGYVVHDVLIPAAKSMICDVVGWGGFAEMLLFGSVRGRGGNNVRRDGGRTIVNYNKVSTSLDRGNNGRRELSQTSRARHQFDDIILETRGEAEEILSVLVDRTIDFGWASVADLYDLVGITEDFTDHKWGWADLRNASVSRVRGGYLINLPRPQPLD